MGVDNDIQVVVITGQESVVEVVNGTPANQEPTDQESVLKETNGVLENPEPDLEVGGITDQESVVEVVNGTPANQEPTDQESVVKEANGVPENPEPDLLDFPVEVSQTGVKKTRLGEEYSLKGEANLEVGERRSRRKRVCS